jgi:hypothetical protein
LHEALIGLLSGAGLVALAVTAWLLVRWPW